MDLQELIREIFDHFDPLPLASRDQMPDIGLYMEQVTSFLDKHTGKPFHPGEEQALTKTMINNYTKAGLLSHPVKKKYDQASMMALSEILALKQLLSVQEIGQLRAQVPDKKQAEAVYDVFLESLEPAHQYFCAEQMQLLESLRGRLLEKGIEDHCSVLKLFILLISFEVAMQRELCQELIRAFSSSADTAEHKKKADH
jgi:hypothetical protein